MSITTTSNLCPLHWCNNQQSLLGPLHWCCDKRSHSGTALYTEQISAQPPVQRLPNIISSHQLKKPYRTTAHHALHCLCLVSESTFIFIMLMSACHSLRSCSPLKTVFGKIGDTYQAYCHTYKTHAMATCHGGSGKTPGRDINAHKTIDAEIEHAQESHDINTNDFVSNNFLNNRIIDFWN